MQRAPCHEHWGTGLCLFEHFYFGFYTGKGHKLDGRGHVYNKMK